MLNIDEAREWYSARLEELDAAQRSGIRHRIWEAQNAVERAEKILVEVTLRDEGGWRP